MSGPVSEATKSAWKDWVRSVLDSANAVDIIGRDTKLEKRGRAYVGLSPLRSEKTASFYVYPDQPKCCWHDFGSQDSGDLWDYVVAKDKCSTREAIDRIALWSGHAMWSASGTGGEAPTSPEDAKYQKEAEELLESRKLERLQTLIAMEAHAWLPRQVRRHITKTWGIASETIDRFKIGWIPAGFAQYLQEHYDYTDQELLRTGSFVMTKKGIEAAAAQRINFPYCVGGAYVYGACRQYEKPGAVLEDYDKAKFKKTLVRGEKHEFVSRWVREPIFNVDTFKRPLDHLLIIEGVACCVAADQYGFNAVSPVTIAPKDKDIAVWIEWCKKVRGLIFIANDNDILPDGRRPGRSGAMKLAKALFLAGLDNVRVLTLPRPEGVTKIDVADYFKIEKFAGRDPAASMRALMTNALTYPESILADIPKGLEGADLEAALVPIAELVAPLSELGREAWVKRVHEKFGIRRTLVRRIIEKFIQKPDRPSAAAAKKTAREKKDDRLRGKVIESIDPGNYGYAVEMLSGDVERISSFLLVPKRFVQQDGDRLLCTDILIEKGLVVSDFVWPKSAWTSKRAFLTAFPDHNLRWTGTDDNVQGALDLTMEQAEINNIPTVRGTNIIGYHEIGGEGRIVLPNGTITKDGWMSTPDLYYSPCGSSLPARIRFEKDVPFEEVSILAKEVIPLLLKVNEPAVILPALGWFVACYFKTRLHDRLGHFPSMHIHGTAGSGKTSIVTHILWPLHGVFGRSDPYSVTDSKFVTTNHYSASNFIAMPQDEFKPSDMAKGNLDQTLRFLRRSYSGESEERGRADLSTRQFQLCRPAIIMGEQRIEGDQALGERFIPINPSKNWIVTQVEAREAFTQLSGRPLWRLAPDLAQWSLSVDVDELLRKATVMTVEIILQGGQGVPPRVKDNLIVTTFGLLALNAWCTRHGFTLPKVNLRSALNTLIRDIVAGGAGGNVQDAFDDLFEILCMLAHQGVLKEGQHYAWVNGKLHIYLRACVSEYLAWAKARGETDKTNGLRALTRIATEKAARGDSYVVSVGVEVKLGEARVRTIQIDPSRYPEGLETADWPILTPRGHGGFRNNNESMGWGWNKGGDA